MTAAANATIEFHGPGHEFFLAPDFTAISLSDESPISDAVEIVLRAKKKSVGSYEKQQLIKSIEQFCNGNRFGDLRAIIDDSQWDLLKAPLICRVYLRHLVLQSCSLTTQQLLECEFNNGLPYDWKSVQDKVTQILALGFTRNEALEAIMVTDNKQVELAAQFLLNDKNNRKLERQRAKISKKCAVPPNRHYTIIQQANKIKQEKEKWIRATDSELQLEIQGLKRQIQGQRSKREELESQRDEIARESRLTLYEEYLLGLTCDGSINVADNQHMERYREQRNISKEDHEHVLKKLHHTEATFDKMKNFDDVANNEDECVVCYEPPKDHVIIPCMHVCLCPDCANDSYPEPHDGQVCPLCNEEIQSIKQVYYF